LRNALEGAERQLVRLDRENIIAFLVGLDAIEAMFVAHGEDQSAVRAEAGRWESLRKRIDAKPALIVAAAANAGGLTKLRSQHAPATGSWWHLDEAMARQRGQTLKRMGMAIGLIAILLLAVWGFMRFFPSTPSSAASSQIDATTAIEQFVSAQQFPEALTAVETARQTLTDDPELLVWEAVLHEQLGDATSAQRSLSQAEEQFAGEPVAFWTLVGNHRQQVGDLAGAAAAGQQALAAAPQDANATFLLGSVAEASGDMVAAAAYFSQTIALAEETNTELGVIAKMRMGNLMPHIEPLPNPAPAQTITETTKP